MTDFLAGHVGIVTAYQEQIDELRDRVETAERHSATAAEHERFAKESEERQRKSTQKLQQQLSYSDKRIQRLKEAEDVRLVRTRKTIDYLTETLRAQPGRRDAITALRTVLKYLKEINHDTDA